MLTEKNWYAIRLDDQRGKRIKEVLVRKKIEFFSPVTRGLSEQETNPRSSYPQPLFNSLLFVYISEPELEVLHQMDGVRHVLYWHQHYAIISGADILAMKKFVAANSIVKVEKEIPDMGVTDELHLILHTIGVCLVAIPSQQQKMQPASYAVS